MSKKHLLPVEICRIINNYLQALRLAKGQRAMDLTELTYRKGFFHLRAACLPPTALAIPHRASQIEAMTAELGKLIPQRTDSDAEEYPE